jgi:hypothetical protein
MKKHLTKIIVGVVILISIWVVLTVHLAKTLYPKVKREIIDISREIKK